MSTASEYSLRESLCEHVLSPIETAERRVDNERAEVTAERNAYGEFHGRISAIQTVPTTRLSTTPAPRAHVESRPRTVERVRNAFRATVMSVDHYDEVYDESLDEHVAAELSPDVAALMQNDCGSPFTDAAKRVLSTAIQRAITRRERFLEELDREQDSLTASRQALSDLLDEHDGPRVPKWYRNKFESILDELAEQRQETLRGRPATVQTDGHGLCTYLYQDQAWTYPVLTALARFRRTII